MPDFSETERMFGELILHASPLFSVEEKEEINDHVETNEFGLALEAFVDILTEKSVPVPQDIIQRIKVLAIHMGMTELSLSGLNP